MYFLLKKDAYNNPTARSETTMCLWAVDKEVTTAYGLKGIERFEKNVLKMHWEKSPPLQL